MGTAGWGLDGGAELVHVLLPPILQTASILDFLGGLNTGRAAKLGPWGKSCPPCTALLFPLSSKIFRGQKCRFVLAAVAWWPERPWLAHSPLEKREDQGESAALPLPTISFRLIPSSQAHLSWVAAEGTLKSPGLTGLAAQSAAPLPAAAVSVPGVQTSPFPWSLAETQKLLLMSTAVNWFSSQNVTLLFTSVSILLSSPAPCGCYLLRCFRQCSCNILLPKCPFDSGCKVLHILVAWKGLKNGTVNYR